MTPDSQSTTARSWHWNGPPTLEAVREASAGTRRFLTESGLLENDISAWELVIAEAGNNCVFHPGDATQTQRIDLLVTVTPEKVIARIRDTTPGFDWPDDPELPPVDAETGRGLFLIHALTDSRTYARGPHGNILELERNCQSSHQQAEDLEATLMAMTEELSSCYESLASIFHFIAEGRDVETLEEFAANILNHLIQSTSSRIGIIRIVRNGKLVTIASHGTPDTPPLAVETDALGARLDRWVSGTQDNLADGAPVTGIVHPFAYESQPLGTLLLARTGTDAPFNAGEESMIRTFSEFFTQHILSRRHEEEAIRSSIARREFELAASIQHSLLPPPHPPVHGVAATGHCESALSIGGDFYDLIPLEDIGYFFVIADVMGKGVGASMMAAVTRSAIRSLGEDFDRPAMLLEKVATQLYDDLDRLEMFVTVAVGVIDVPAGVIRIANAGHCPVAVVSNGSLTEAGPENPPVGIENSPNYPEHEIKLTPGARLLAFTDGIVDPRNERPCFESENLVCSWFEQTAATTPELPALKSSLLDFLGHHSSSTASSSAALLADDQTFLLIAFD
ncbi:MAG: SpoIIE family protein phosphatase [Verrucomicrobiota bacterium JB025]|nr:SpoIIE family protein phosphatase [Verrucomicrobiota bacterium JB025]